MENTLNAINIYFFKSFNGWYVNPAIGLYWKTRCYLISLHDAFFEFGKRVLESVTHIATKVMLLEAKDNISTLFWCTGRIL